MLQYLLLALVAWVVYLVVNSIICLRRNLSKAKASGIHYVIVPVYFLQRFWLITHRLFLGMLAKLPRKYTEWVDFCLPEFTFDYRHEAFERVGHDTFLTVSPGRLCMYTCEPAVITQITTRRNDFPKPTKIYRSLDIYGKNVVSSEGAMWRQHRKATSPPFTEKNNHLVWAETIDQASAMLKSWVGPDGQGNQTIHRVADDTMRLSLHVISRAGFGRKMEWPAANVEFKSDTEYADPSKIKNEETGMDAGHSMSYTYAIHCLLDNILFQFLLPRWMLEKVPFKIFRKANEAYSEWGNYMKEAVEAKKRDIASGNDSSDQMDLIGQLVKNNDMSKEIKGSQPLTDAEVLGNMFVFILAGHETAANSIHFSLIYLALHPQAQHHLQKDLDAIFHGAPPSEWDYDRDLPALFGGMPGAVLAEELRLVPPVIGIPKSTFGVPDQSLSVEGRQCTVPGGTYISLATAAAHRNPKYWPAGKANLPGGKPAHPIANVGNDLEEFRPERWLVSSSTSTGGEEKAAAGEQEADTSSSKTSETTKAAMPTETVTADGLGVNLSGDTSEKLYAPPKGSYLPFSEGYRACLGRRFAQVEVLAALAVIFQNYSIELAVDKYVTPSSSSSSSSPTSSEQKQGTESSSPPLSSLDANERAELWQKAAQDARELMLNGLGVIISLQMRKGHVPLRFVPRGKEVFTGDEDEIWKRNHPDLIEPGGVPGWRCWPH